MQVDPPRIATLKESIRTNGKITEPISVWFDGERYRIYNGMHRTYCAKQLVDEIPNLLIPAVIIDCDEVTFLEARVSAASPHIAIKESRINDWIRDAWSASEFGKDADVSLLSSAYGVYQRKGRFGNEHIQSWFDRASKLWGIHIDALAYIILGSYRTENGKKITNHELLDVGVQYELPIDKFSALCDQFQTVGRKGQLNDRATIEGYVKDVIIPLTQGTEPIDPKEYLRQKYAVKHKPRNSNRPTIEETERTEHRQTNSNSQEITIERWANTVNGARNFVDFLSKLLQIDYQTLFKHRPKTQSQIADMFEASAALSKKVYGEVDPTAELVTLRRENERLNRRIEAMTREYTRPSSQATNPANLALSSAEIETLP